STNHLIFFFQTEDGIRDLTVTGAQTCAIPICALYCLGANANALAWRITLQSKWLIKRQLRAHLPEPWKNRIKRFLGKPSLDKQRSEERRVGKECIVQWSRYLHRR